MVLPCFTPSLVLRFKWFSGPLVILPANSLGFQRIRSPETNHAFLIPQHGSSAGSAIGGGSGEEVLATLQVQQPGRWWDSNPPELHVSWQITQMIPDVWYLPVSSNVACCPIQTSIQFRDFPAMFDETRRYTCKTGWFCSGQCWDSYSSTMEIMFGTVEMVKMVGQTSYLRCAYRFVRFQNTSGVKAQHSTTKVGGSHGV